MKTPQEIYEDICMTGVDWKNAVVRKSADEWIPIAEKLAKKNGGILLNPKRLQKNGHYSLVSAMARYPDKFRHIKQRIRQGIRG